MSKPSKLYYKTCREKAGLTQEEAVELLGIADATTLSKYENGHIPVGQDLVKRMVGAYNTPSLAWWFVVYSNPDLATYLPDPPVIKTDGDMMLRLELASDDLAVMRCVLKTILRDGVVNCEKVERLRIKAGTFRATASKLMEIAGYLDERGPS
ncbi:MAG: helix-turn-helix transcriptional regulator [Oscillospiraceae bacterium]|nr:helix-turn-helix transcriptional regulator [Oscillospiraceae bacterium]